MATRLYDKKLGIPEGVWALIPDDKFSAFLDAKNELEATMKGPVRIDHSSILLQRGELER